MAKIAWLNDIHLDWFSESDRMTFFEEIASTDSEAVLIGGDISLAADFADCLEHMAAAVRRHVFFVLGNHDYYGGSIDEVRHLARRISESSEHLHWLPAAGVVELTDATGLLGHGGWADARCGDFEGSDVVLNDYVIIKDLACPDDLLAPGDLIDKARLRPILHRLGDEAAEHFSTLLPDALERFEHLIVLMHVPPFRQACWYDGRISTDDWLPHMTCKAVGEVLQAAMSDRTDRTMTVLCGHTHGQGEVDILPNLRVLTGKAVYGHPGIQRVLNVT